jgi:hypothetical protein
MAAITDLARPAAIDGPDDPELARLWSLALAKYEAQHGAPPGSRADWREVTADYGRLVRKPRGPLTRIIQERCEEAPGGD